MSGTSPSNVSTPSTTTGNAPLQITTASAQYCENVSPQRQHSSESIGRIDGAPSMLDLETFVTMEFGGIGGFTQVFPTDLHSRDHARTQQENIAFDRHSLPFCSSTLTLATAPRARYLSLPEPQTSSWRGSFEISASKRAELLREMNKVSHPVSCPGRFCRCPGLQTLRYFFRVVRSQVFTCRHA